MHHWTEQKIRVHCALALVVAHLMVDSMYSVPALLPIVAAMGRRLG